MCYNWNLWLIYQDMGYWIGMGKCEDIDESSEINQSHGWKPIQVLICVCL